MNLKLAGDLAIHYLYKMNTAEPSKTDCFIFIFWCGKMEVRKSSLLINYLNRDQ